MSTSAIRRKVKSSRHRSLYTPQGWSKSVLSNDQVGITTITRKGPNPHTAKKKVAGSSAMGLVAATLGMFGGLRRRFGSRGES